MPDNFFDNPQNDPANKGKAVAATRKEQTLQDEMDEFNSMVKADLAAADVAAEDDEEDLEEQKLRDEVFIARQLEERLDHLKARAAALGDATAAAGPRAAAP